MKLVRIAPPKATSVNALATTAEPSMKRGCLRPATSPVPVRRSADPERGALRIGVGRSAAAGDVVEAADDEARTAPLTDP
ncbi:MAG TPA: hypothetical protein PL196_03705, partial [Burkholderiaceae bacterium]|nr:hypothetical protein [Burkholderiaceae bacterium]